MFKKLLYYSASLLTMFLVLIRKKNSQLNGWSRIVSGFFSTRKGLIGRGGGTVPLSVIRSGKLCAFATLTIQTSLTVRHFLKRHSNFLFFYLLQKKFDEKLLDTIFIKIPKKSKNCW